ncbi:MAG: glycosyltransferase [Bacteroidetes bacterium]|nr:glycosyltransferase [Bacteroidota bacterium]
MILPSKFDTFSCVVLESLSCGLPMLAYKTKGPKDIIQDENNGYLVSTVDEMIGCIVDYFSDIRVRTSLKKAALIRSAEYNKDEIITRFIADIGLSQRSA